jgi:putative hemolysin
VEAEIERSREATTTANQAVEKATTAASTAEAAARNATQTVAQEKMALEVKVAKLERDLATTGVDHSMANCQFSEVTNRLLVVSKEATRLREDNSKLSQDLDGELD